MDPPALPEAYQRLSVQDCRIRLRELQREAAQRSNGRSGSAESREWAGLASHYRMALVLLAGIDGEIEELALRDWREMPPPERDAIRRQIRALRSCLLPLRALALDLSPCPSCSPPIHRPQAAHRQPAAMGSAQAPPHMVQRAMQALEKALPPQWLQPMKLLGLGDWQRARNTPTASPSGLPATTRWPPLTTLPAATAVRPNGIWTTTRSARWPGA